MKNLILLLLTILLLPTSQGFAQYTPDSIYTAARSGNLKIVQKKLAGGFDQNMLDNTLGAAVVGNHPDLIKYLAK